MTEEGVRGKAGREKSERGGSPTVLTICLLELQLMITFIINSSPD